MARDDDSDDVHVRMPINASTGPARHASAPSGSSSDNSNSSRWTAAVLVTIGLLFFVVGRASMMPSAPQSHAPIQPTITTATSSTPTPTTPAAVAATVVVVPAADATAAAAQNAQQQHERRPAPTSFCPPAPACPAPAPPYPDCPKPALGPAPVAAAVAAAAALTDCPKPKECPIPELVLPPVCPPSSSGAAAGVAVTDARAERAGKASVAAPTCDQCAGPLANQWRGTLSVQHDSLDLFLFGVKATCDRWCPDGGGHACPVTIVDVGANKGYTLAPYFQMYGSLLYDMTKHIVGQAASAERDHRTSVTVHALEPLIGAFQLLQKLQTEWTTSSSWSSLGLTGNGINGLHLHNVAMSDTEGEAEFTVPNDIWAADEGGALVVPGSNWRFGGPKHKVKVNTVDNLFAEQNIQRALFMKIDTEGNDGRVILGAIKTLTAQKIGAIGFEYSLDSWVQYKVDLKQAVDFLSERGYVTYLTQTEFALVRIDGAFWRDKYRDTVMSQGLSVLASDKCMRNAIELYGAKHASVHPDCWTLQCPRK